MKKPQISLITAGVLAATLLASTTTLAAATHKSNYKGEAMPCPVELVLKDGLYVGLQAGYDSYRVATQYSDDQTYWYDNRVENPEFNLIDGPIADPLFGVNLDPRLNATGAVGGGFIGYGKYFDGLNGAYLGIEIYGNWSGAETDYELSVIYPDSQPEGLDNYTANIQVQSNYGVSLLPGIKLNNATLLYVRLGYNWANIKVKETVGTDLYASVPNDTLSNTVTSTSDSDTVGGFNYGLGVESTFYDNWSIRAEYSHTDFDSFTSDYNNKYEPADNQFMLGLIYHINM